jgi:hypothetical protein
MTAKSIIPIALLDLAGILSLTAALHGGIALAKGWTQAHGALLPMFCIPLILLVPFYCVTFFRPRLSIILQLSAAVVFLVADFWVNLHACGNGHLCPDLLGVAIASFFQPVTLVPFMIAALQILSRYMREWEPFAQNERRSSRPV